MNCIHCACVDELERRVAALETHAEPLRLEPPTPPPLARFISTAQMQEGISTAQMQEAIRRAMGMQYGAAPPGLAPSEDAGRRKAVGTEAAGTSEGPGSGKGLRAPPTAPDLGAWQDAPLPEDDAILAASPLHTGRNDIYAEAMRLVGARHSKGGLVALVNWLLVERLAGDEHGRREGLYDAAAYVRKLRDDDFHGSADSVDAFNALTDAAEYLEEKAKR